MDRVGLIGLGRVGGALLPHLVAGSSAVTVWNRSDQSAVIEASGAKVARSAAAVVEQSDIILSVLFDDAAVEQVYFGESGLLAGDCAKRVFVEMSTIGVETSQRLANAVVSQGGCYLEAPVLGSTNVARVKGLTVLAGGECSVVDRARPVLGLFSSRILHLGAVGNALTAKHGIQLVIYSYWQALSEAIALVDAADIDTKLFIDIVATSPAGLRALPAKVPVIAEQESEVGFSIAAAEKDLRIIVDNLAAAGNPAALARLVLNSYSTAAQSGLGELDAAAISNFWRE
ncbi:2-hydroxy-3-oxopropionate reductase OS=Afipia felis OX=1035 GN=glxR PE=3 SV=1 [Afipia felis]